MPQPSGWRPVKFVLALVGRALQRQSRAKRARVQAEARKGLEVPQFIFQMAVTDRVQNGHLRLATTVDG
jgi:hypothetical protein